MTKVSFDPITLKNMLENYGIWDQTKFDQGRRDTYDMIKKTPKNEQVTLISQKITSCMNRIQYGDCKKAWELAYWLGCLVKLDEFAHMYARPPKIDLRKRKYHEDYKIEFPCNYPYQIH